MSVLPTFSDLSYLSPLSVNIGGQRDILTLSEMTDFSLLHFRGMEVERTLPQFGIKIGGVASVNKGMLIRLRRDEYTLLTGQGWEALNHYGEQLDRRHITVTDITHGRCMLLLIGPDAPNVLRKVCGLDFGDVAFPNSHAAQTSLAKVRTLIVHTDFSGRRGYMLIVDRSLGPYVWDTVIDAMQEFIE